MIGIRADANGIIASGHVMRCIAIAEQIESYGESVIFITADHFSDALLDEKGLKHTCLDSNWKEKYLELDALKACIREWNINTLLVDSYEVTVEYLKELYQHVKLAYIDDLYLFSYPVDMIINYAIDVDKSAYPGYRESNVQWLLGTKYTPLRKEFGNSRIQIKSEVKNVMLTTGGSDNYHVMNGLAERISKMDHWKDICFHFIIGGFFNDIDISELEKISSLNENIVLHRNVKNMAEIMTACDLAVSAAGTTLAELCACRIPTICFAIADNQLAGASAFERYETMAYAGDIRGNLDMSIDSIIRLIERLKNSKAIRNQYSENAGKLIDGSGASNIAEHILHLNNEKK